MAVEDPKSDPTNDQGQALDPVDLGDEWPAIKSAAERRSLLELTKTLVRLPLDQSAAALETGASIAGVSLRASIEFLRAAPAAARVLAPAELRSWGELGRR